MKGQGAPSTFDFSDRLKSVDLMPRTFGTETALAGVEV